MAHKIATCSYCGTRAALVLDRARHELACSSCGAPLHDMKAMPKAKSDRSRPAGRPMTLPRQDYEDGHRATPPPRKRTNKRRKGIGRRIFEELWDVVEDVFD
ncbi:hypothetical protein [Roseovarius ramblicola]|uniref:TFIIB zinc-binding n=1 Tax=Roseovarius ramblicola TaxID=2022336 RepID=A0ABV5I3Y6_9RHOB